ncbi:S9 family peptidase [Pleionea sp. CnH1-48]|uniref:alpha/beta hydrolase family protein n=1 Tax=Pleionea sp. CnH1-48 TaxID=2954494 RepID=UPI002097FFE9|nr:alpha/beta fold hydrolase [Pleionea sp. CnH1-48]MCO7226774.1 prolyl oligopeptidase family serine peptidase [Pleionea sp. CnH1-48]
MLSITRVLIAAFAVSFWSSKLIAESGSFDILSWFEPQQQIALDLSDDGQSILWLKTADDGRQSLITQVIGQPSAKSYPLKLGESVAYAQFLSKDDVLVQLLDSEQHSSILLLNLTHQRAELLVVGGASLEILRSESDTESFWVWNRTKAKADRFDFFSRQLRHSQSLPKNTRSLSVSGDGNLCLATDEQDKLWQLSNQTWKPLLLPAPFSQNYSSLEANTDCQSLWFVSNAETNTSTLYSWTPGRDPAALYRHTQFDVDDFLINPDQSQVEGIYFDGLYPQQVAESLAFARLKQTLLHVDKHGRWKVIARSKKEHYWIIFVESPTEPGLWLWVDSQTNRVVKLHRRMPQLNRDTLFPTQAFTIPVKKAAPLTAYLTSTTSAGNKKRPLIIKLHGGPFAVRNQWRFLPEEQWLAQQGYQVLTLNYRGSSGFGKQSQRLVYQNILQTLNEDIEAAVDWLEAAKRIDSDRICLMGASFGGFAALSELIERDYDYLCGVLLSTPVNFGWIAEQVAQEQPALLPAFVEQFGDYMLPEWKQRHDLSQQLKSLEAPVLIIHGGADEVVQIKHAEALVKQLKQLKKSHQALIFDNEAHGIKQPESRNKMYQAIRQFLRQHLSKTQ